MIETIGTLAAALSILGFIPQAVKTLRTRRTRDLSLGSWLVLLLGSILWLIYGFNKDLLPIILVNSVLAICSIIILITKYKINGGD